MIQKLIIISGSPCVGKTAVSEKLYEMFENSAYCDGDWLWCVHPFSISDPRLRDGDKNMSFVLSTYLKSKFNYVFFSSVVATNLSIRKNILKDIDYSNYDVLGFTLTCSKDTLKARHLLRGDKSEVSYHWLELEPYPDDIVINTDNRSINDICEEIYSIITK